MAVLKERLTRLRSKKALEVLTATTFAVGGVSAVLPQVAQGHEFTEQHTLTVPYNSRSETVVFSSENINSEAGPNPFTEDFYNPNAFHFQYYPTGCVASATINISDTVKPGTVPNTNDEEGAVLGWGRRHDPEPEPPHDGISAPGSIKTLKRFAGVDFEVVAEADRDTALTEMVKRINLTKEPAVMFVMKAHHAVVVNGFSVNQDPTSPDFKFGPGDILYISDSIRYKNKSLRKKNAPVTYADLTNGDYTIKFYKYADPGDPNPDLWGKFVMDLPVAQASTQVVS